MTTGGIREARLRRSYAALYPDLEPGVWMPACVQAEFVLERGLYQRRTGTPARYRLLDASHFEFRGGPAPDPLGRPPTRLGDLAP
jgi:hypothetical protein